jgi:hypothetical protein
MSRERREAERQEALGHLTYFEEMLAAQEQAAKRMSENIRLCKKNVALWEGRIARMEKKA